MRSMWKRVKTSEDGLITTGTAWLIGAIAAATVGTTVYSSAQESAAAKKAAEAQRDVGMAQIAATKESEVLAKDTATTKLKAARAKKSNTILTSPLGVEDENVNTPQTIGV
ncbi:MAG: hypothetical protein U9O94_04900 [Nanoarchaeota archaeon]|nr:hypothetical protein [Nanoarchaeota archaeon]